MLKGLGELKAKAEQAKQYSDEDRILPLKLNEGDQARIRILTDTEDIIKAGIHELTEQTPKGMRYPKKYCTREESGNCEYCKNNDIPKQTLFFFVYVYEIMHKRQNPMLEKDSNAAIWSQVKHGGVVYYKEEVNGVRVLRTKKGKNAYIEAFFINFADEYGTWCDRDYKWARTGASKEDTAYSLTPKDPSKMTQEIKDIKDNLPNLADYVTGKIFTFAKTGDDASKATEAATEDGNDDLF
jgi:hypothetical protein